ncbi:MAG: hypothetical protein ACXADB_06080 [Candidatus Hermodarchaeia archaeon]|jgi:hypothetical protein
MYKNDRGELVDPDTPCPGCGGDGRVLFIPTGEFEMCKDCGGSGDKTEFPNVCSECKSEKVKMWVGGNTTPRRIELVCPKCEGNDRVGKVSDTENDTPLCRPDGGRDGSGYLM